MLEKIGQWLQGKKTYIVAVLIGVGAVLFELGIAIPVIVWPILAALGLGAVRSALDKLKG